MNFRKFVVLTPKDTLGRDMEEVEMLFNLDHIVSLKPIRINRPDKLINGFWIRTTNGKKYKATKIPDDLIQLIGEKYILPLTATTDPDAQPSFQ
ncbi:MAG: hypothetical protein ACOVP4_14855 [Bacteriovoracaceae bacterium]|jgi:hypothetical protein